IRRSRKSARHFAPPRVRKETDHEITADFGSEIEHFRESKLESESQFRGDAMRWTVAQVAEALGVAAPARLDALAGVAGVSIDSRTIRAGELFIAIHGPSHDGHDHVAAALAGGGAAGVVARARLAQYAEEIRGKLFAVDDTLDALHRLASRACAIWRTAKPGRKIGGVAGSVGKTTTKEIFAALVAARFHVLKTQGNLNNEYGLSLTLVPVYTQQKARGVAVGESKIWRGHTPRPS